MPAPMQHAVKETMHGIQRTRGIPPPPDPIHTLAFLISVVSLIVLTLQSLRIKLPALEPANKELEKVALGTLDALNTPKTLKTLKTLKNARNTRNTANTPNEYVTRVVAGAMDLEVEATKVRIAKQTKMLERMRKEICQISKRFDMYIEICDTLSRAIHIGDGMGSFPSSKSHQKDLIRLHDVERFHEKLKDGMRLLKRVLLRLNTRRGPNTATRSSVNKVQQTLKNMHALSNRLVNDAGLI